MDGFGIVRSKLDISLNKETNTHIHTHTHTYIYIYIFIYIIELNSVDTELLVFGKYVFIVDVITSPRLGTNNLALAWWAYSHETATQQALLTLCLRYPTLCIYIYVLSH